MPLRNTSRHLSRGLIDLEMGPAGFQAGGSMEYRAKMSVKHVLLGGVEGLSQKN